MTTTEKGNPKFDAKISSWFSTFDSMIVNINIMSLHQEPDNMLARALQSPSHCLHNTRVGCNGVWWGWFAGCSKRCPEGSRWSGPTIWSPVCDSAAKKTPQSAVWRWFHLTFQQHKTHLTVFLVVLYSVTMYRIPQMMNYTRRWERWVKQQFLRDQR